MLKVEDQAEVFSKKKVFVLSFASSLVYSKTKNIAHDLGLFSTSQKLVLSSCQGQSIFEDLELRGFEAKDFKMCARIEGLPRGLHL